jgi:hypothetical protein
MRPAFFSKSLALLLQVMSNGIDACWPYREMLDDGVWLD